MWTALLAALAALDAAPGDGSLFATVDDDTLATLAAGDPPRDVPEVPDDLGDVGRHTGPAPRAVMASLLYTDPILRSTVDSTSTATQTPDRRESRDQPTHPMPQANPG